MSQFRKVFSAIICYLLAQYISLVFPGLTYAAHLQWTRAEGIESYSQEVRVAPSDPSIVYSTIRNSGLSGLYKSNNFGLTFSIKFPLSTGRDVNSIAISSKNPNKLCIGTYEQGVFCSVSDGDPFSNSGWLNSGLQNIRVRFITVDPLDDDTYYVGTGENNSDGGIFKTVNGGISWTKVGATTYGNKNCLNIFVDQLNPNRVFAGSDFGLYRSFDAGNSWAVVLSTNISPPATLVDSFSSTTIYSSANSIGVYKSISNGDPDTWLLKNSGMGSSLVFRLAEDNDGSLYASRLNSGGGVWRSQNAAETWENVGDISWGTRNTWGLDARGGKILVSVEGLGLYVANTDGSAIIPAGPSPVVFIPGFGGSWSYKGLILNQNTTYKDWQLIPKFADSYYGPLFSTLENAGLVKDQSYFIFGYDYRKSIAETGFWLNDFLANEVQSKNPGVRANIAAHSMGGLVARYCFEKVLGCANKINKIVTGGTPYIGTLAAYDFWEAGKIHEKDLMLRTAERLLLHLLGFPQINPKEIVHTKIHGVQDLLPIFDYINGKSYFDLIEARNPILESTPPTMALKNSLVALSGNTLDTAAMFEVVERNRHEALLNWWVDGKPRHTTNDLGDTTVLRKSSEVSGATNYYYPLEHKEYFNNSSSLNDILKEFNLTGIVALLKAEVRSHLLVTASSNVKLRLNDQWGNQVETTSDEGRSIFVNNPQSKIYNLLVKGEEAGEFFVHYLSVDLTSEPIASSIKGKILKNEVQFLRISL